MSINCRLRVTSQAIQNLVETASLKQEASGLDPDAIHHLQTELRDILWILKRVYGSEEVMRAKYDNGMAASHLKVLEDAVQERVLEWKDDDELRRIVREVP